MSGTRIPALFAELGPRLASMEAAKILDAFGCQPGYGKEQADAIQAYVQATFNGIPTWLELPRNRWPKRLGGEVLEAHGPNGLSTVRTPRQRGYMGTAS